MQPWSSSRTRAGVWASLESAHRAITSKRAGWSQRYVLQVSWRADGRIQMWTSCSSLRRGRQFNEGYSRRSEQSFQERGRSISEGYSHRESSKPLCILTPLPLPSPIASFKYRNNQNILKEEFIFNLTALFQEPSHSRMRVQELGQPRGGLSLTLREQKQLTNQVCHVRA